MARYKVIVLGVQGINNKVYGPTSKDANGNEVETIVTEAHFPEGNAAKLEKEGKLKKLTSKKEEAEELKAAKAAKIKALQAEINSAKEALAVATSQLTEAPAGVDKTELIKAVDDAQLAFDIANENFEKA